MASEAPTRTTLMDVAKLAGVSPTTVSLVLSGKSDVRRISEETHTRVREAANAIGYRANHAARSLSTGRTGLISLWLWSEDFKNSYHAAVSHRMHAKILDHPYQLMVNPVNRATINAPASRHFDAWHVDGIISHEAGPAIEAYLDGGLRPPVPVVSTGAYHFLPQVDRVVIDFTEGARLAMKHLLSSKRRRIVYVTDSLAHRGADPRFLTYGDSMEAAGLPREHLDVPSERAGVRAAVREYVQETGAPDALFCHNDDIAIAAYRGLCDLRIRVPDQTAIVGCDGIEDTEYLEVPVTTIAQPLAEMCDLAIRFLEQRIAEPSRPLQEARLQAKLIVRESTGSDLKY